MDLTPVYELRERLQTGAVAGTGLIMEDFRLKRAVEAAAPLEKASPVLARIVQLSGQIVSESCEDRAGALLDALTLLDALLCTQGTVEAEGVVEPLIEQREAMGAYMENIPYSVLSALLDALQHSGGGRYSYVVNLHKEQPQLFRDYRVRAALVDALGASYGELAEDAAGWLIEDGIQNRSSFAGIRFLLEKGFDPKGKKEMARRVQVLERVVGAEANDFYLKQLGAAKKEVRAALIHALRHNRENEELLLSLRDTETGNNKKMALYALACMSGEKTWAFFESLAVKDPLEAVTCMEGSGRPEAAKLVSGIFFRKLADWRQGKRKPDNETEALLNACISAFSGKCGTEICECYRQAARVRTVLDGAKKAEKNATSAMLFFRPDHLNSSRVPFSKAIQESLFLNLLMPQGKELAPLAWELYQTYGDLYFPAVMAAAFRESDGAKCQALLQDFVEEKGIFGRRLRKDRTVFVWEAFSAMKPLPAVYADGTGGYVLQAAYVSQADLRKNSIRYSLYGITEEIFSILMRLEDKATDILLAAWIQPDNDALCRRLSSYFYIRAQKEKDNRLYLEPLKKCGFESCKGLAVHYFKGLARPVSAWEINSYFGQLPGSAAAKTEEAGQVLLLLQRGIIKGRDNCAAVLEAYIQEQKALI